MTISRKLKTLLEEKKIAFKVHDHPAAYTAQEIAGAQHVPGAQLVKAVIVKIDGQLAMCVLPSTLLVDFTKLKAFTKAKEIKLATEPELAKLFPEYELGAEPPFGNLYGLKVFADRAIEAREKVFFNAGSHVSTVSMDTADLINMTKPLMGDIGKHI